MRHIVHHVHVQIIGLCAELLGEGLAHQEGHAGAVHPGVVSRCSHPRQVVLALL